MKGLGQVAYAKYKAEKGTWVSASFVEQGYSKLYGSDVAYGAYLGLAVDVQGNPLNKPDSIVPGQEYMIPIGTIVQFQEDSIVGRRLAQSKTSTTTGTWRDNRAKKAMKDLFFRPSYSDNMNYPSWELQGPKPPSSVPRDAVAYWLSLHRETIVKAEKDFNVNRLAIAGVIAYEALENPMTVPFSSAGPGKMHVEGKSGMGWPEAYERSIGLTPFPPYFRREILRKPGTAIEYIAGSMDLASKSAEKYGWNIRNDPGILGLVYHAWEPESWKKHMSKKAADTKYSIQPGTMGQWILDNQEYLEKAVGRPEIK